MGNPFILEMKNISKSFHSVKALSQVTLNVREGTIHSICGENGAGKSTLMKVLSGVYPHGDYEGEIFYKGQEMMFRNIKDSEKAGIVIIHQELTLIPELSIMENIFLGNEIVERGLIDWDMTREKTIELLEKVGLKLKPNVLIKTLGVGQQQMVEIAKALSKNVKLLILDEPTAALNETDSKNLLMLMKGLKEKGITCIMISHKLNEIAEVSDDITVIRDGQTVETYPVKSGEVDENRIIKAMVGRPIENRYPPHIPKIGDVIFKVSNWNIEDPNIPERMICKNSEFYVRAGEIVGFAGLVGAGRTELMRSIFGRNYGIYRSGELEIKGKRVELKTVYEAIKHGLAYVPEDRKNLGLNLLDSIEKTITSANLKEILSGLLLSSFKEKEAAENSRKTLGIKTKNVADGVTTLSGGNQQKVVLGKWLFTEPEVLILDEPTRGIDVGAKFEIYKLIHEIADRGKAVILISSELPELIGMSDRIYAICEGRITGMIHREEATQETLMRSMTDVKVGVKSKEEKR